MKKNITKLLGIEYPILQGAMAWIADGQLAAAVSAAGGLGIIASGNAPLDWVRSQIHLAKSLTDRPFGVNIVLLNPDSGQIAKLCAEEKVKVVTTGAGNPTKYIDMWKENGIIVIPVIPTAALAQRMERAGADAVICEGCEAGGHIGELTTMTLVPAVCDSVDIPVIAAGGIADGRGMLAAMALGASGFQLGTRFIVADECNAHSNYKDMIIGAKDTDTAVTGRSTGHPVRGLKNKTTRKVLMLEREMAPSEEIDKLCIGGLRNAVVDGDVTYGSVMAGQCAALVKRRESCREIIMSLVDEAKRMCDLLCWQ